MSKAWRWVRQECLVACNFARIVAGLPKDYRSQRFWASEYAALLERYEGQRESMRQAVAVTARLHEEIAMLRAALGAQPKPPVSELRPGVGGRLRDADLRTDDSGEMN